MTPKETVRRYKQAVSYLDGCGDVTLQKLRKAQEIAGSNMSDAELSSLWAKSERTLEGPEVLREEMRKALIQGIEAFGGLVAFDNMHGDVPKKWWQFWK